VGGEGAEAGEGGGDAGRRQASRKVRIVVESTSDAKVARHEETSFLFPR